jgi:hypothetical protein
MIRQRDLFLVLALLLAGCAKQAPPPPPPASSAANEAPPPAASARPAFLAPRRGEVLLEGQSFTIRWQAPGWDSVNVAAVMGGKDRGHLVFGFDARADSLVWQVPVGWVTGFGITRSDSVRLRLEDAGDPSQFVDSEPFTVSGADR